jgi:hypothetical protein
MSGGVDRVSVSIGVLGSFDTLDFLQQLPALHAIQRDSDRRGVAMRERKLGAFVSEHRFGSVEIHVREEFTYGVLHRFYVMTGRERRSDIAEFLVFAGTGFDERDGAAA